MYSTVEESTVGGYLNQPPSVTVTQQASTNDYTYGRNANYTPRNGDLRTRDTHALREETNGNDDFTYLQDGPPEGFYDGGSGNNDYQARFSRPQYEKFCKRTVLLSNLPDAVTHAEVVDNVRGGMLLDIFLRTHDRAASVSFLEEAQAQEFLRHVKRHDLYSECLSNMPHLVMFWTSSSVAYFETSPFIPRIAKLPRKVLILTSSTVRGRRVEIRWNDRQFILPPHVANKVGIGATRNLVIRNCNPNHTEEAIRDDLEHIHNLVVIKVTFNGQNAYIQTNSVHNALFARTCMMSRA
jgi:hypothetical protein